MLAAHHCSKKVMYTTSPAGKEELCRDLLDDFEQHKGDGARVVASSLPIPVSNQPGDNPPHAKAKARYEEIVDDPVLCTAEYPSVEDPRPIVFGLVAGEGLVLLPVEELEADRAAERVALGGPGRQSGGWLLLGLGLTGVGAGVAAARRAARARRPD